MLRKSTCGQITSYALVQMREGAPEMAQYTERRVVGADQSLIRFLIWHIRHDVMRLTGLYCTDLGFFH